MTDTVALITAIAGLVTAIAAMITIVLQGRTMRQQGRNLASMLASHEQELKSMDEVDQRMQQKFDHWMLEVNRRVDGSIQAMGRELEKRHNAGIEALQQRWAEQMRQTAEQSMADLLRLFAAGRQEQATVDEPYKREQD